MRLTGTSTSARSATASLLLLVMLAPFAAPLALAQSQQAAMHCARRPIGVTPVPAPAMHCHGMMGAMPASPTSPEATFQSRDCCANHDCCRSLKTSEWARPAASLLSVAILLIEPVRPGQQADGLPTTIVGPHSARAPPRS
jgi:hypothetical protein